MNLQDQIICNAAVRDKMNPQGHIVFVVDDERRICDALFGDFPFGGI